MNQPSTQPVRYQPLLRRVALLAGISFLLALLLTAYLFDTQDQFFSRLFGAFFVFFWLLAVTFLGAVPFVTWAATHWFGASWSDAAAAPTRRKRPLPVPPVPRKPARATARLNPTQHP
ncbi:hypothetical protein KLP40_16255 [Hymenobacter sp. NST-14]|uniref:hypothetical protein n=1 Tax=Hymenobacter piscis TaxID=2839984 RepID=UPI001C02536A|nr:hypothetical protein [Hymenobacter piscis]MBT9394723.1 hypothetical protein [Hymenobacter piscis]